MQLQKIQSNLVDERVLNFWGEDLRKECDRLKELKIGEITEIEKVNEGYYYFNVLDPDNNICEITDGYNLTEEETSE